MLTKFSDLDRLLNFQQKAGFTLAPLQVEDIEKAVTLPCYGFFYEVGGGKTVVSTAVAFMHNPDICLISVRPVLIDGWRNWLKQFGNPVLVWEGVKSIRAGVKLSDYQFVLVTPQSLVRDEDHFLRYVTGKDAVIIIDEAQDYTNSETKRYQVFERLRTTPSRTFSTKYSIWLTGTPWNKPDDPYAFIKAAVPKAYYSLAHYHAVHVTEYDFFDSPKSWSGLGKVKEILNLVSVTRTKEEIHGYNLKPIITKLPYSLEPKYKNLYDKFRQERLLIYGDEKLDGTEPAKFRHILNRTVINHEDLTGRPEDAFKSTAFQTIDYAVEQSQCADIKSSKLIIWTVYRPTTEKVLKYVKEKLKINSVAVYGDGNSRWAQDQFINNPDVRIGVIQYQSGGAGLNPQKVCHYALFFDPTSDPNQIKQAIGRLDRMGQAHKPVMWLAEAEDTAQEVTWEQLRDNCSTVEQVDQNPVTLEKLLTLENFDQSPA